MRLLHAGPDRLHARPAAAQPASVGPGDPGGTGREPVPLYRVREDHGRRPDGRRGAGIMIIEGAHVVTVSGEEYPDGHVVVEGNRITAVGAGPAADRAGHEVVDARGCLLTPGFVNTHNHLYQWVTRGLAVDATLFE